MNRIRLIDNSALLSDVIAQSTNSNSFSLENADGFSVISQVTVGAPAVKTFTDAEITLANENITITAHGYATGLKVALTTSGALPTGLSAANYYVIKVDADTIRLASSAANAAAGTAVDITVAGSGTHTLTPATLSGASVKLQGSNDESVWVDLGISNNITVTANFLMEKVDPMFKYARVVYTLAAGQLTVANHVIVKG